MAFQPGVEGSFYLASRASQNLRNGLCIAGMLADPKIKRFQTLQHDPGVERAERRAGLAQEIGKVICDEGLVCQNNPAKTATLPVNMLGCGVNHHIRPEFDRALQDGRCKHIVHDKTRPRLVGDISDGLQVQHLKRWVGRCFKEEDACVGPHGSLPLSKVGPLDQGGRDTKAGQKIFHNIAAGAEQRFGGNNMVAC